MNKVVIAKLSIKEGLNAGFAEITEKLIALSRAEKGNIKYELFQEIENPANFIFYEEYENQEAFDFHSTSDHFKEFVHLVADLQSSAPDIKVF